MPNYQIIEIRPVVVASFHADSEDEAVKRFTADEDTPPGEVQSGKLVNVDSGVTVDEWF